MHKGHEANQNHSIHSSSPLDLLTYLKKQFPTPPTFNRNYWDSLQGEYWRVIEELATSFEDLILEVNFTTLHPLSRPDEKVVIHSEAKVHPTAVINGPCIVGPRTEIRPGAWIRENVRIGADCIIGHACEFKNCWLGDQVQTSHYNYVGDSILGNKAHLGAGAITSNFRLDHKPIRLRLDNLPVTHENVPTFPKCGAILGEESEVGSQSVLNPGVIIGRKAMVYPLVSLRRSLDTNEVATN